MIDELGKIRVEGGDDCPESAISALIAGIKLSKHKSFVFLFTDSNAKDYHKFDTLIELMKEKRSYVNVFVTSKCSEDKFPKIGHEIYYTITKYGQGQVFDVTRDDISDAISTFMIQLHISYETIFVINSNTGAISMNSFYPDSTMKKILITIAGSNPEVTVFDPQNKLVDMNRTLNLPNVIAGEIDDPIKGKWTIKSSASASYTIKIGAETSQNFRFGFSAGKSEVSRTIIDNVANRFTIEAKNPINLEKLSNVVIISKNFDDTSFVIEYELKKIGKNTYQTREIKFPMSSFEIFVAGVDKDGEKFERFIDAVIKDDSKRSDGNFSYII